MKSQSSVIASAQTRSLAGWNQSSASSAATPIAVGGQEGICRGGAESPGVAADDPDAIPVATAYLLCLVGRTVVDDDDLVQDVVARFLVEAAGDGAVEIAAVVVAQDDARDRGRIRHRPPP
jgi:hypothetical protein